MSNYTMTNQDIQTLSENALHEACRHIQDALGVESGDTAGLYFTGDREDIILDILTRYIDTELMLKDISNATKDSND
jgi:hypothetical protein